MTSELIIDNRFSEEEQSIFMMKMWELLGSQAIKYCGIDSTSMPIERAQSLLSSLLYTFFLVANETGIPAGILLNKDFDEIIHAGQDILEEKKKSVQAEWNEMCLEAPQIENVFFVSTLRDIGEFFGRYNIYHEAHEIPCSIDYPLLSPVPESLQGISFIEEYIRHVRTENRFINSFPQNEVLNLLQGVAYDYKEAYQNLCEPVLTHALDCVVHIDSLAGKEKEDILHALEDALESLCIEKSLDAGFVKYFHEELNSMAVRIEALGKSKKCATTRLFITS